MNEQRRLLVTGATGFIGTPVLRRAAARGWRIHAVSSRPHRASPSSGDVTWHVADLLAPDVSKRLIEEVRPEALLHLAWDVRPGGWSGAGGHLPWARASLALLEQFADCGGRRVLIAGSCAEYDWSGGVCHEFQTPIRPATVYGAAKAAVATVLPVFAEAAGLSSAWARIFFAYGPGERPERLVASVIRALLAGQPALCSPGDQVRDFLHVDDLAGALVTLLESDLTGPVNIGSGVPLSVAELARSIGRLLERPELVKLGARPAPAHEAPLVLADVGRLRDELQWSPSHDVESGLRDTIAWWRTQMEAEGCAVRD